MKQDFKTIIRSARMAAEKHSPEILTGLGIAGMLTTVVLAVKVTPKAVKLVENKKTEEQTEKLGALKTVKTAWKCYIPAAVICVSSVACIVGASSASVRRNAALATAYSISETALREYKDKVVEVVGEKKEQAIRDAVAKDKLEENTPAENSVIFTGKGETLCYDSLSGRYFKSDVDKIKKAENVINHRMLSEMYVSLNELYYELGLEGVKLGDMLGWHVDKGCFDIGFSSQLTPDNTPCLVLNYSIAPRYDYDVPWE